VDTSPDGLKWSRTLGTTDKMMDVAWNGKVFVAVGSVGGGVYSSPDAVTWTKQSLPTNNGFAAITWTGSEFLAGGATGILASSPDGTAWTIHLLDPGFNITALAAHNGTVVLGTDAGMLLINKVPDSTATPVISLDVGSAGALAQVTLHSPVASAKIYYTDNGQDPTPQSNLYTTPFTPTHNAVIKARAYLDGVNPSEVAAAEFKIGASTP